MLDRDFRPRSAALPLGHKLIALILAAAAGWGAYSWLSYKTMRSARTAELSFDATTARTIDPGLAEAREPAVALAQSILNDQAIAGLSKQAYLASSVMDSRIGEFRSRLDLAQPSAQVLDVRFQDTDATRSRAAANAIAEALATWNPSAVPTTAPAATPQPAASSTPAPVPAAAPPVQSAKQPSVRHTAQPDHSLSDALGALEEELATTNRQVDRLSENGGRTRTERRPHSNSLSSYNQSKQQQLMRNEVKAAQKQLDHLQVKYANADPGAGIGTRLSEIRQALASVWPASRAGSSGFNGAGVSASQLRRERAELSQAVRIVERERKAIQHTEVAQGVTESNLAAPKSPASSNASAAGSATPSPAASTSGPAASTPAPAPPSPAPGPAAGKSLKNPLQLVRLAGSAAPIAPWPAVAAGVLCGLIYLGAAKWRYRSVPNEDYIVEDAVERVPAAQRFITPNVPPPAPEPSVNKVADLPAERSEPLPASFPRQRAFFTFDPAPEEDAPSHGDRPEEPEQRFSAPAEEPPAVRPERTAVEENVAETGDPVADRIRKAFSEGSIRTLFEESATRRAHDAPEADEDSPEHSAPPDRLAG